MKKYLAAVALAATLAQPASAITFPSLTTIYVGVGVTDTGGLSEGQNYATVFGCTNVSGKNTSIRLLILNFNGSVNKTITIQLSHGQSNFFLSRSVPGFIGNILATGVVTQGTVNIEATESAVFCTALLLDATTDGPNGVTLDLVRVNPHPGTVE